MRAQDWHEGSEVLGVPMLVGWISVHSWTPISSHEDPTGLSLDLVGMVRSSVRRGTRDVGSVICLVWRMPLRRLLDSGVWGGGKSQA